MGYKFLAAGEPSSPDAKHRHVPCAEPGDFLLVRGHAIVSKLI